MIFALPCVRPPILELSCHVAAIGSARAIAGYKLLVLGLASLAVISRAASCDWTLQPSAAAGSPLLTGGGGFRVVAAVEGAPTAWLVEQDSIEWLISRTWGVPDAARPWQHPCWNHTLDFEAVGTALDGCRLVASLRWSCGAARARRLANAWLSEHALSVTPTGRLCVGRRLVG